MVYYFLLVLVLDSLITPGDDEWQVAADIRDGQMNAFLIKPVNYLVYRLALFVSNRLALHVGYAAGRGYYFCNVPSLPGLALFVGDLAADDV